MNPQSRLAIPIPIIEEIIALSQLKEKLSFRLSCKLFFRFTNRNYFPSITTTLCGCGERGNEDGDALGAKFHATQFGALDTSSNILYVSENHTIRKVKISANKVSTLCGYMDRGFKDGVGTKAQFNSPTGLALNAKEKILYIADSMNNSIRRVNLTTSSVRTICGNGRI